MKLEKQMVMATSPKTTRPCLLYFTCVLCFLMPKQPMKINGTCHRNENLNFGLIHKNNQFFFDTSKNSNYFLLFVNDKYQYY